MNAEPADDSPPKVVALHERACDNLTFIRETMARSGSFTAVSGWANCLMGVIAIAGAISAGLLSSPSAWLTVWLVTASACATVGAVGIWRKARRSGAAVWGGPGRRFLLSLAPPMVAGAVLTLGLGFRGMFIYLPALWLLLYGAGVVTGGAFSIKLVPLMGLCFMVLGSLLAVLPSAGSFQAFGGLTVADLFLAGGFGGLNIIFGVVIALRYGG